MRENLLTKRVVCGKILFGGALQAKQGLKQSAGNSKKRGKPVKAKKQEQEEIFIEKLAAAAKETSEKLKKNVRAETSANSSGKCGCPNAQNNAQSGAPGQPSNLCLFEGAIGDFIEELRAALFPEIFCCANPAKALASAFENLYCMLLSALSAPEQSDLQSDLQSQTQSETQAQRITLEFLNALIEIRRVLKTDLTAGYRGDPAAKNEREIALCYPCFYALLVHRTAHFLYEKGVPVLPRMMSEIAHSRTGIDIHPGAKIGEYFFIDHGTGVVIGETATIGKNVKLYQGVTIGAKSFRANPDGSLVKGVKRHPDILNDVVIYANASVLGGGTVVGNGAVIGGNAWVTHSVADGVTIPSNYVG